MAIVPIRTATMVIITLGNSVNQNTVRMIRRWPEAGGAAAALLIVLIALPSFMTDVRLADAHLIRWNAERNVDLSGVTLRRASLQYEDAARHSSSDPLNWERGALLAMLAAEASGQTGELGIIRQNLIRSAMLAPSRGTVWTRLVYVDYLAGNLDEKSYQAWRMASLTSRLEFDEMKIRLWLGLLRWPDLPPDIKADLVVIGKTLWSGNASARKGMAGVYKSLPGIARARIHLLLPNAEKDIPALEALASGLP